MAGKYLIKLAIKLSTGVETEAVELTTDERRLSRALYELSVANPNKLSVEVTRMSEAKPVKFKGI